MFSCGYSSAGKINGFKNLDSIKSLDPNYLKEQLEIMKKQNKPIAINYLGQTDYIYYKDSDLLNKLTYYPLALILILLLFLAVIYLFYSSNKIAETNKLWTGMAKETAHQIGTPLSSLLGWIAILKMENADDKYVDEIQKDVHRLNTIANRFSKIGSLPTEGARPHQKYIVISFIEKKKDYEVPKHQYKSYKSLQIGMEARRVGKYVRHADR